MKIFFSQLEYFGLGSGIIVIRTKNKANAALALSFAGVVFIYPYQEYFWGGLLLSGCLAALIGGLADWFAVTALFRKPMGIAYRTEIIPRNRERMLREIIDFTAHDLLNPANIMKIIKRYDMVKLLLAYLEEAGGKDKVKLAAHDILCDVLGTIDKTDLSKSIQPLLDKGIKEINIEALLSKILNKSLDKKYDDAAMQFFIQELIFIVRERETQQLLETIIENIKAEYESTMARRQLISLLMQLSPEHMAQLVQAEIIRYLEQIKDAEHPLRNQLKEWLYEQAAKVSQVNDLDKWQVLLINKINDNNILVKHLEQLFAKQQTIWIDELNKFIDDVVDELKTSHKKQELIDSKIKVYLNIFVNEQHSLITQMIKERINDFSDDELVDFVEKRIADDLQMIRINGSLIGALVGMGLYIITYLAERSW